MLKFHSTCRACKRVKQDPALLNRIYNSAALMGKGESLLKIWEDNKEHFLYRTLTNHVKKHQFLNENDYTSRHLRQIANQAEKEMLKRTIESKQVWDSVINKGMLDLETGEMNVKASDLLKAAKDKSDYQFKVKDQEMAMMEMVYHFASGENNMEDSRKYDKRIIEGEAVADFDPSERPPDDTDEGEGRPSGVYYPPAWDAPAPGPNPLPRSGQI